MRSPRPTTACRKDLKCQRKRGKDLEKRTAAIETLQETGELPPVYLPHKLSGNWNDVWECHIEPDWLLRYVVGVEELQLIRTGSHADLF